MKKEDPRKMPLGQCVSLGDMMAHIEECKRLDEVDEEMKRKHKQKQNDGP